MSVVEVETRPWSQVAGSSSKYLPLGAPNAEIWGNCARMRRRCDRAIERHLRYFNGLSVSEVGLLDFVPNRIAPLVSLLRRSPD
jgi:hypothetical protein